MQHERRSGRRHAVLLSVELHQSGKAGKVCRVHNIAPEGMLLENKSNVLDTGSEIELQISWNGRSWAIPATVTHCNSNCIGVMFNQRQSVLFRTVTQPSGSFKQPMSDRHFMAPKPS